MFFGKCNEPWMVSYKHYRDVLVSVFSKNVLTAGCERENNVTNAHEKAIQLLARREHSRLELKQKLLARGYSEQEINALLDALEIEQVQSDARFAGCYVRSRLAAGFGPLRIEAELQERGVSSSLIVENIYQPGIDWEAELQTLWQKKFDKAQDNIEKQYRFLQSRGYTLEQISKTRSKRV